MGETSTDPMVEITAMKALAEALSELDAEATARVLRWAGERFGVSIGTAAGKAPRVPTHEPDANGSSSEVDASRFRDLAELCAAASPNTDADRALLAGYWFQVNEGQEDFAAQTVNSALKNLGHRVSNITGAFNTLRAQKPALVIQIKKSGSTRQARKLYKLTAAGKKAVEQLIGHA